MKSGKGIVRPISPLPDETPVPTADEQIEKKLFKPKPSKKNENQTTKAKIERLKKKELSFKHAKNTKIEVPKEKSAQHIELLEEKKVPVKKPQAEGIFKKKETGMRKLILPKGMASEQNIGMAQAMKMQDGIIEGPAEMDEKEIAKYVKQAENLEQEISKLKEINMKLGKENCVLEWRLKQIRELIYKNETTEGSASKEKDRLERQQNSLLREKQKLAEIIQGELKVFENLQKKSKDMASTENKSVKVGTDQDLQKIQAEILEITKTNIEQDKKIQELNSKYEEAKEEKDKLNSEYTEKILKLEEANAKIMRGPKEPVIQQEFNFKKFEEVKKMK